MPTWDTIMGYMNSFLGAFFLFLSFIFIPEIRKSKKYWIPISVLIILLLFVGIDKNNRDNRKEKLFAAERADNKKKTDSLFSVILTMAAGRKQDNSEHAEFRKSLETKFNIIQDSLTNQPVLKTFNTHIKKVGTLNMY